MQQTLDYSGAEDTAVEYYPYERPASAESCEINQRGEEGTWVNNLHAASCSVIEWPGAGYGGVSHLAGYLSLHDKRTLNTYSVVITEWEVSLLIKLVPQCDSAYNNVAAVETTL